MIHLTVKSLGKAQEKRFLKTELFTGSEGELEERNESMKAQVIFGEESLAGRRGKGWGEETMAGEEAGQAD